MVETIPKRPLHSIAVSLGLLFVGLATLCVVWIIPSAICFGIADRLLKWGNR